MSPSNSPFAHTAIGVRVVAVWAVGWVVLDSYQARQGPDSASSGAPRLLFPGSASRGVACHCARRACSRGSTSPGDGGGSPVREAAADEGPPTAQRAHHHRR